MDPRILIAAVVCLVTMAFGGFYFALAPGAGNVPAIAESYPGVEVIAFNAILAPGGTAAAIVERLSTDIRAVVGSEAFRDRTKHLGINSYGNTPAELSAWMTKEIARWKDVVQAAGIKPE